MYIRHCWLCGCLRSYARSHTCARELSPAPGEICCRPSTTPSRSTLRPITCLWRAGQVWVEAGSGESVRTGETAGPKSEITTPKTMPSSSTAVTTQTYYVLCFLSLGTSIPATQGILPTLPHPYTASLRVCPSQVLPSLGTAAVPCPSPPQDAGVLQAVSTSCTVCVLYPAPLFLVR